jgi:hypothetical protein
MAITTDPSGNTIYTILNNQQSSAAITDAQTTLLTATPSLPLPVKSYTVATLPTGLTSAYAIAFVTDANATTRLSTPAGGGSNKLLVFTSNNGTAWTIL